MLPDGAGTAGARLFGISAGANIVKAIVGLGNPGPEYRDTRHNIGFAVLDRLATRVVLDTERYESQALVARAHLKGPQGPQLLLVKPLTYMNRSGQAVRKLVVRHRLGSADLLVIHDDMDLTLGRVRLRPSGSSAGHRGIKSIIEHLGTDQFGRLRCGIGHPEHSRDEVIDYVLSPFAKGERELAEIMIESAVEAALCFVTDGIEAAMNEYNSRNGSPGSQV